MVVGDIERAKELVGIVNNSGRIYNESMHQWSDFFTLFQNSLDVLPQPVDITPHYGYEGSEYSLEELFSDTEVMQDNSALGKIVDGFYQRFEGLNRNLEETIAKSILINRTVYTKFIDENGSFLEESERIFRNYEPNKIWDMHLLETVFQSDGHLGDWEVLYQLLHDSIEDSHRYDILQRWYVNVVNLETEDEKLLCAPTSEELELIGITKKYPIIGNGMSEKRAKKIFNEKTQGFVTQLLDLVDIKLDTNPDLYRRLFHAINIGTKRPYEGYEDYLSRLAGRQVKKNYFFKNIATSKRLRVAYHNFQPIKYVVDNVTGYEYSMHTDMKIFDGEVKGLMTGKGRDRKNNTVTGVPEQRVDEDERDDDYILRIGEKWIKDVAKNFFYIETAIEVAQELDFDLDKKSEDAWSMAYYGIIGDTIENIDRFVKEIEKVYGGRKDKGVRRDKGAVIVNPNSGDSKKIPLSQYFKVLRYDLWDYYQDEGAFVRTSANGGIHKLGDYDGTINALLSIVNKKILVKNKSESNGEQYGLGDKATTTAMLYQIASLMGAIIPSYVSHTKLVPSDSPRGFLRKRGVGIYDSGLENFHMRNFGAR